MPATESKKIPWLPILLLVLTAFLFWALPPILGERQISLEPITPEPTTATTQPEQSPQ